MKEISVRELKAKVDNKEDFQLIDVREQNEKDFADIGGELIPLNTIPHNVDKINKNKEVIVYCRSGGRSGQVVHFLESKHGFQNVFNLKGGILAWAKEVDKSVPTY